MHDEQHNDVPMNGGADTTAPLHQPQRFMVIRRILDALDWLCITASGIGLVFIVVSYGWMVYSRYILNDTPTWIGQLALLLFVHVVCYGTAAGVYRHNHLSIDFVREMFPPIPRAIAHFLSDAMVISFGFIMALEGWVLTLRNVDHRIPLLGITSSWQSAPLIVCGVLMIVFTVFSLVERITAYCSGDRR